jgi:two-component system, OmpR family, response regulator PrrA
MTVGPLTIDAARRLVFAGGERVNLTKREFDLLAVLAENAGVVLSRQRLLELVWGYDFDVDTNVADVFISYLRRKLEREGLPRVIHTVRGIGYVLRDEP